MMLRLEKITKTYADGPGVITALARIDLELADGTFVVVMGPSGSGKTTLALIAAGVERPTSGAVWLDQIEVARASRRERARLRRRQIGVVFQHDELDPVLSASENVALPLVLDGRSSRDAGFLARQALERCGVLDIGARMPSELSGGQRQRVGIARAIVGERRLIVADEPTAAIDTATARSIVELFADLAKDRLAVLMTTHDSRLAGFADDVVLLRDGVRVRNGERSRFDANADVEVE
jgi:putative ABC transport system ATP-binding protein